MSSLDWINQARICLSGVKELKILREVLLVLAISVPLLAAGCGGGGGSSPRGAVSGTVRTSLNVRLPGATVSCSGKSAQTDSSGDYKINDVPIGTQTVSASKDGYMNADGRGQSSVLVIENRTSEADSLYLTPTVGEGRIYLTDMIASSQSLSKGRANLGGIAYLHSFYGHVYSGGEVAIYSIGKQYARFQSKVGVSDNESNLSATIFFVVTGDNNELYRSKNLKVGETEDIDIPVAGVLTLQLAVYRADSSGVTAVWGDPRVAK